MQQSSFNSEEQVLDFLLYSDILNNYEFLQSLQTLNIRPTDRLLKWKKDEELKRAKRKKMFQDMYNSAKQKSSSSDKSVLFSGDSSSDKITEQEETELKEETETELKRETETELKAETDDYIKTLIYNFTFNKLTECQICSSIASETIEI